jgi:hypothetical protein
MILARRLGSVRPVIAVALLFVLLFHAACARAQLSKVGATLEGSVHDSSGAVISGTTATLRNALTNQSRTVTTDEQGFFRADQLGVV